MCSGKWEPRSALPPPFRLLQLRPLMIRSWKWSLCLAVCRWLSLGSLNCSITGLPRYWPWSWRQGGPGRWSQVEQDLAQNHSLDTGLSLIHASWCRAQKNRCSKLGQISTKPVLLALTFSGGAPCLPLLLRWDKMRQALPGLGSHACSFQKRQLVLGNRGRAYMASGESVASPSCSEAPRGRRCHFWAPPLLISGDGLGRVCQSVGWGRVVLLCTETWMGADLNCWLCCSVCSHSRLLGFHYFESLTAFFVGKKSSAFSPLVGCWFCSVFACTQ